MHNESIRVPAIFIVLGCSTALTCWIPAFNAGKEDTIVIAYAAGQETEPAAELPQFEFKGALECSNCHTQPLPKYRLSGVTDFVLLTEFVTWLQEDKHSRAYLQIIPDREQFDQAREQFQRLQTVIAGDQQPAVIEWGASNELSARMCRQLGIETKEFNSARQCLSCHANWRKQDAQLDQDVQMYAVGVGCEACHGASSEWIKTENHQDDKWRTLDPRDKHAKFGMINVRDPADRARQCFSCHIGNAAEGKFVTHEMYAAGHPPLPGIEIETFATQMPRHWRYLDEKADFKLRDEFEQQAGWSDDHLPQSAAVVFGGVTAHREAMNLFAEQASYTDDWPEFAMFDCQSCHHELKMDSWRQQRGYSGRPGRPPMPQWPAALVKLGIAHSAADDADRQTKLDELADLRQSVQLLLDAQPFGNPQRIAQPDANGPVQKLAAWLDDLSQRLRVKPFTRGDAKQSLEMLCGARPELGFDPTKDIADYHAARQVAWAIQVMHKDLKPGAADIPAETRTASSFEATLAELNQMLLLQLPSGAGGEIARELEASLNTIASFDRQAFLEKLNALKRSLPDELKRLDALAANGE